MAGLYDDTPGLSDGTGLWRGRLGLFSGASGFINGSGGAYVDLYFSAGTYSVAGNRYTTLGSIPGFTFTRASLAMGYDATGKLTYGPNNLLLQSQTFGVAPWSIARASITSDAIAAPDGTLTADKLVEDTSTNTHQAAQNRNIPVGQAVYSIYAKAAERTWAFFEVVSGATDRYAYVDLATGAVGSGNYTPTVTDAGGGWWRVTFVFAALATSATVYAFSASANGGVSYTGDGTSGIYLWGAQLEAVTYQTTPSTYYPTTSAAYYGPRLVYDPVTLASQGILVEEARTNIALQSQTFDNASWSKARATITANAATSPDGTTNADAFNEDATAASGHELVQAFTKAASAVTYTSSVFVKKGGRDWICVTNWDNSANGNRFWFNVNTGVIGSTSTFGTPFTSTSYSIQQAPNGFWRCITTFTTNTATAMALTYYSCAADGSTTPATGLNAVGLYLWQAQLEAGTGASSSIPTTTASVTRAADDAVLTGLSVPDGCTVMFEAYTPAFVSTDARMSLSDGTTSNRLESRVANTTSADIRSTVGGSGLLTQTVTVAAGSLNKVAASSLNGVFAGAVNGVLGSPASGGTMPTLTQLDIGKNPGSSIRYWNAPINRMRVWKSVQSVTSITQSLLLQEDGYSILQEDNSYIWLE